MKSALLAVAACLFLSVNVYSQCTPGTATGTAGVTPSPANVPCIERGVPYSIVMQLENFSSFTTPLGAITVDSARIDSLVNFPCGITAQPNKTMFASGETGCILVSGTTTDYAGQYPLKIYMTLYITVPFFGSSVQSGEITSLIATLEGFTGQPLGIDMAYHSRVIDEGASCPAIDTSASANNLTASGGSVCPPPPPMSVTISGNTSICSGNSTTLTANVANITGSVSTLTYSWSNGSTAQTINVTTANSYSVTATHPSRTATASVTVSVSPNPSASFTSTVAGLTVTLSNTSTGATSHSWNFGDGQTTTIPNPAPHTYSTAGTYPIMLIVTSAAGGCMDTVIQNVTVGACTLPTADFTTSASELEVTVTNNSADATSYFWDFGDGDTSSAASPSHTYDSDSTYTITLVATNSCGSDTTTQDVTVTGVFVNSVENDLGFDVFPNPSTGLTSIIFPSESAGKNYELSILDLAGKEVFEETYRKVDGNEQKQLDLSGLTKGTYIIQLKSGDRFGIKKLDLR